MRFGHAGVFKAWALVGARLYSVPLRVPRKFYVNSVLPPEDPDSPAQTLGGLKVSRTLPFGREAFHIYEASSHGSNFSSCPPTHTHGSTASYLLLRASSQVLLRSQQGILSEQALTSHACSRLAHMQWPRMYYYYLGTG